MDSPGVVVFESFLYKTPPLDKLIVNWKKRWFVLRKKDPFDPASVELVYYADPLKKELRGTIPVKSLLKVYHTPTKNKSEHVFAVDMDDKKFLLKATDHNTKSIWLAKLMELISNGDQFHVTVPHQPCAQFSEAVLKTSLATKIDVICPSTSNSVLEIPLDHVRRFGYELMYDIDMVWFEICTCKSKQQGGEFHFCIVASGISAAHLIVVETKRKIEVCTRAHLIQEQSTDVQLSFISRAHYGCIPFPPQVRTAIVQTSLTSLQSSWGRTSRQGARKMSAMGSSSWSFSPGSLECNQDRRSTVQSLLTTRPPTPQPPSPRHSPSPSPGPSPAHSPSPSSSKTTLNELRRGSHPSTTSKGSSSRSDTSDSGVPLDEFDSSRSAPPHSSPYKKTTLDGLRRANKSFDYGKGSPPVRKKTLGDLKSARVDSGTFFPSKDSVLEGSGELIVQGKPGYDHLDAPQGCGSLLPPSQQPAVPPRSLASLGSDYIRT